MTTWPTMERRGPSVSEKDVRALEAQLGVTLPDEYRQFVLEVNGGRTDDEHVAFFCSGNETTDLDSLFSLNDRGDRSRDLATSNRGIRHRNPSPNDLLYVGYDGTGNMLFLCLRGEHRREVWYFDTINERPEGSNPRVLWHDRRDMGRIARNFHEFMSSSHRSSLDCPQFGHPNDRSPTPRQVLTMRPTIRHPGPPITEDDITDAERQLGARLPDDYRAFLLANNGGTPQPPCFDPDWLGAFYRIKTILSDPIGDVLDATKRAHRDGPRVMRELVVVGYTLGGDKVCIGVEGNRRGQVFLKRMDTPGLGKLADSFDAFLDAFHECPE